MRLLLNEPVEDGDRRWVWVRFTTGYGTSTFVVSSAGYQFRKKDGNWSEAVRTVYKPQEILPRDAVIDAVERAWDQLRGEKDVLNDKIDGLRMFVETNLLPRAINRMYQVSEIGSGRESEAPA